jgi:hypothetical protein
MFSQRHKGPVKELGHAAPIPVQRNGMDRDRHPRFTDLDEQPRTVSAMSAWSSPCEPSGMQVRIGQPLLVRGRQSSLLSGGPARILRAEG